MSFLNSMTIQGIRSFNPEIQEKIKFETPLTILLGANGCGKTTVIESLKYITTGDLPPGLRQGGSAFVHDPKISNLSEVKGQIKLNLQSIKGENVTLTKSMLVSQKKTKTEFKSLESVVHLKRKDGREESLSGKCIDFEREAVSALGVSKAVLNNVLFCHQDDSNWPLSEPKSLKDRFDDIFNAKQYIKALDSLKGIKKTQDSEIKLMKEKLLRLQDAKDEAENKKQSVADLEDKIESKQKDVVAIKQKLEPIESRLGDIEKSVRELHECNLAHEKLKTKKTSAEDVVKSIRAKIKQIYDGSDEELKDDLENFKRLCDEKMKKKVQMENRKNDEEKSLSVLRDQKSRLSNEKGKLETEKHFNDNKVNDRTDLIKQVAADYHISGFSSGSLSDTQLSSFRNSLDRVTQKMNDSLTQKREDYKKQDDEFEQQINESFSKKATLIETARLKEETCSNNKIEINQLKSELNKIDASQLRLTELEQETKTKTSTLQDTVKSTDEKLLEKEINDALAKKEIGDIKFTQLKNELKEAHRTNDIRSKLEVLVKDKSVKEQQLEKYLDINKDILDQYFPDVRVELYKTTLDNFLRKQNDAVKSCELDLKKAQMKSKEFEVNRQNLQRQLSEKDNELKKYNEEIIEGSGGGEDIDEQLVSLSESLEKLRVDQGTIFGAQYLYDKYIKKLKEKPCCPLCLRNFTTEKEANSLVNDLNNNLQRLPSETTRLSDTIKQDETKQQNLLKLQPKLEMFKKLRDEIVPDLKRQLDRITEDYRSSQKELSKFEDACKRAKMDETNVQKIKSDVALIDSLQSEVKELERKINQQESSLNLTGSNNRPLARIQEEVDDLDLAQNNAGREIELKRKRLHEFRLRVQKLQTELNDLKSEQLQITQNMQKRITIQTNIAKLTKEIDVLKEDANNARHQLKPLEDQLLDLTNKRDHLNQKNNESLEKMRKDIDVLFQKQRQIEDLAKSIEEFEHSGVCEKLTNCLKRLKELEQYVFEKESAIKSLAEELSLVNNDLDGQESKRRDLQDNLDMRNKCVESKSYDSKIHEYGRKIEKLEAAGLNLNCKRLREEHAELTKAYSKAEGTLDAHKSQRDLLSDELKTEKYKRAVQNYSEMLIDICSTKAAVDDVCKLMKALEYALLAYHGHKMKQINETIRRLWRKVYKGGDIDYVEIIAEGFDENSTSEKRKIYNYRVVMYVNGHQLDMRGRCSAGQKVLASIIIRIALADVFCSNCGVLALDEPTTNLDVENANSLAEALYDLIQDRSEQKNFQLLLITHDQQFVRILARQHAVDHYYHVSKNDDGYSQLERRNANDFLSQ